MSRRPSFQFYPGDWLSSLSISTFSAAEVGAYIQLLCHAWLSEDCGLPDDEQVLAQISWLAELITASRRQTAMRPLYNSAGVR